MKKILFFFCLFLGLMFFTGFAAAKAIADTYSPLDFAGDYQQFEVKVGFDQQNGRYFTYSYAF